MEPYEVAHVSDIVEGFECTHGVVFDGRARVYGILTVSGKEVSGEMGWPKWSVSHSVNATMVAMA